jgi:integrase
MAIRVVCPECKRKLNVKRKDPKCLCGFAIKKHAGKVYEIDYLVNGKRKRERIGESKNDAEYRLNEVQNQIKAREYIPINKNAILTLNRVIDWYQDLAEVTALSSFQRIKDCLANIVRIMGKDILIQDISLDEVQLYRKTRGDEDSKKYANKKVSVATVNREVAAIKRVLNLAAEYKKTSSNPIATVKMLPEHNIRERVLTDEEFERLLNAAPEHIKPILIVAFYEPMRFEEIILLKWNELDVKSEPGFIRLPASRVKGKKKGRAIPMHPRVKETLRALSSRFQSGRVFQKRGKSFYDFRKSFNQAKEDAGIEDFLFHDFRHCAVTNLRRAGNDIATIMKISGHKTLSMFQRYNLVDEKDISQVVWKTESPEEKHTEEISQ